MKDHKGEPHTTHTTHQVSFISVNNKFDLQSDGTLCDVLPTLLQLLDILQPKEMTGKSLILNFR